MTGERRYDRDEVDRILRTAARIEPGVEPRESHDRDGLTLSEIQEIGAQAGIDSSAIATATVSVALASPKSGGRGTHHVHVIPGELRGAAWDRLADHLRGTLGSSLVSRSTSALEMEIDKGDGTLRKLLVSVRSANGTTTVSIWADAPHLSTGQMLSFGLLGIPVVLFPVVASSGGQWPSVGVAAALAAVGVALGSAAAAGRQRWATTRWQNRITELLTSIVATSVDLASSEELPSGK